MHLQKCMAELGFKSSKVDPDVWFRASKRKNGEDYSGYALLYFDNCLVISDPAELLLKDEIGQHFFLNKSSIGAPSQYLGGNLRQVS